MMHTTTISNLFHAIGRLEHTVTQVAGLDTMSESDSQILLGMINACTHAANASREVAFIPHMLPADPTPATVTREEAMAMDDMAGLRPYELRSA